MTTTERDKELSIMQHLGELRHRLLVSAVAVILTTGVAFVFAQDLIGVLLVPSGIPKLIAISPTEAFTTYMRVALFSGIAFAMPVLLYEVFAYVDPALHPHERRFILTLGPFVIIMFVLGMAFSYFVLLRPALGFLFTFGGEFIQAQPRASEYISFVTTLILGMGLVFEMPVIIYGVTKVGLVKRSWLAKQRRYVFLLAFILGAIITPTPDPFNQTLVAVPMYLLWELGLLLARFA